MAEPIAIVGTACRFPGSASSPSKLWDLLKAPRDVLREFPSERFDLSSFHSENGEMHGRTDVHNRAYLLEEDCRLFDAAFFRTSPKEAAGMDPQQRILLETVYEALESAGWPLERVEGSLTSVYAAVMTDDYHTIQARDLDTMGSHAATGLSRSILSNRVSYAFDLKGPSMTVDTACSGSLVALHLAVQGLRNGDASQAIVAGTNLLLDPYWFVAESSLHMLSPDSRSRMWDADANGYARGEGCAAVVLKPLSKAIQDGDHIESIIRQTGVNSDGRTNGITMPSSTSQAALIRQVYDDTSLNPLTDCQYFECHGTGTQAGDPVEARAIRDVFCPPGSKKAGDRLYCGSIKTIIGHLEGCAGLAGVLKTSLAIQNKMIPPNMHFTRLNPAIEPFYTNLCIPETLIPWPDTYGQPRRASVNSFGFGGTNAHAILESYEPSQLAQTLLKQKKVATPRLIGPFVFSARSRAALVASLSNFAQYIDLNPSLDLDALSCVLQSKRSALSHRLVIPSAKDASDLLNRLGKQLAIAAETEAEGSFGLRAANNSDVSWPHRILGVFTGQGAQAVQMGRELMSHCPLFRKSIRRCEEALAALPEAPTWSVEQELRAPEAMSRLSEALISQPLCTAIQIALVDLLRASGVRFAAVVGHSSGEIGAAYAAGILNLSDAMGIAYYRGYVAHLARGSRGEKGGMMATALSLREATALCAEARFVGRVGVAASNAPSSVTLSGDLDAILGLKAELDGRRIQARLLRVDTAYHSHHMLRCADAYLQYLTNLNICVQRPPDDACAWYSSALINTDMTNSSFEERLKAQYWVDNMVNAVFFSEAVHYAGEMSPFPFSIGIEVGPHPALKGPVVQTLKPLLDTPLPYAGCLERGKDSVETLSTLLGFVWSYLGPFFVNFSGWREAFGLSAHVLMIKDLPSYPWDHDSIHWHDSRIVYNHLRGGRRPHILLGRLQEENRYEHTWRNIIHLDEIPWMRGHTFQGQVLFPGAGYVNLAMEAARSFLNGHSIKLIEIHELKIVKALVIEENAGVETLFTIRSHVRPDSLSDGSVFEAEFVSQACSDNRILERTCEGKILVHVGEQSQGDLPPASLTRAELAPLSIGRFHKAVAEIGLGYDGVFRALTSLSRSWGHVRAAASWARGDLDAELMMHPALLDQAFQVGLATFLSTAEKSMPNPYLPIGIRRVIVDPSCTYLNAQKQTRIDIEAQIASSCSSSVEVDINVFGGDISHAIQIDGLVLHAIADSQPSEDRNIFVKTVWEADVGYGLSAPSPLEVDVDESTKVILACERTALFFMRNLINEINTEEISSAKWHHRELMRYARSITETASQGDHPILQKEWLGDDRDTIQALAESHPNNVDLAMLTAVGDHLPSVVRGESEMIEHMMRDDLLSRLYRESGGLKICNHYVGDLMRRISHKFPRTKILEVGAGTGGTTLSVLEAVGDAYASYTCTDISSSFFHSLSEKLPEAHTSRVGFKVFNVETAPSTQGFTEGEYDVVIAANVLHATRRLSETVRNARALLRPGGYLIAVEVTGTMLRETGLMGGLEGWWLGANEGRTMGPGISVREWDRLLQEAGFSGVDCVSYDHPNISIHSCSVFAAQAIDDSFDLLRDPLPSISLVPSSPILIIGGRGLPVARTVRRVEAMLRRWAPSIMTCDSIDDLDSGQVLPGTCVLCLADLDRAFFADPLSAKRSENLREMLATARNILWVTRERLANDPYSNMMVGVGRALSVELPHVNMHFLDFDDGQCDVDVIIRQLLRQSLSSSPQVTHNDMLWVSEPEVVIKNNEVHIPRIVQDPACNEVLNAKRRRMMRPIGPEDCIEVSQDATGRTTLVKSHRKEIPTDHREVRVTKSIALHSINSENETPTYLCCGYLGDDGSDLSEPVLTMSTIDSSHVIADASGLLKLPRGQKPTSETLVGIATALIAIQTVGNFPSRGTTLVYGATCELAEVIEMLASQNGHKVVFVTISTAAQDERPGWICLHPRSSARSMGRAIPRDTKMLFTFTDDGADVVLRHLPKICAIRRHNVGEASDTSVLAPAHQIYQSCRLINFVQATVINIKDVPEKLLPDRERLSAVVDWARDGPLACVLQPLEPCHVFSPDKTYLLVGMAGELGQSLCRFMVGGGARHIVLASRNPTSDPHWIAELRGTNANIRVVKMDVTDPRQVRDTVALLRRTMPKIGGVANAALVFEAGIFVNFSAESIARQLKPKVDGTIHLDEAFSGDDLDFFLTFGSLATVCGNPGQALYHAGNMFMTSMVEKRRRRGQAASILHFGLLTDVGYVARMDRDEGTDIEDRLRNLLLTPLSESEFHHVVMQGIISGRPDSPSGEVIMGMQPYVDDGKMARPPWVDKAFFSHMIYEAVVDGPAPVSKSTGSMQNLRDNLDRAENLSEATEAVQEMLYKKIEMMMKTPKSAIDPDAPLADLGLDSLNGIDIRKWLLQEMQVDVPLLRILGREPMSSICASVAKQFMERKLVETDEKHTSAEKAVKPLTIQVHKVVAEPVDNRISTRQSWSHHDSETSASSLNSPTSSGDSASVTKLGVVEVQGSGAVTPFSAASTSESTSSDSTIEHANLEGAAAALQFGRVEPLSLAQAGIHFLHTFLEDGASFNVTTRYRVRGRLDVSRLARAVERTIARHEAYQTCFFADPGSYQLKQRVATNLDVRRLVRVVSSSDKIEEYTSKAFDTLANQEYRLSYGETFRCIIVTDGAELHNLVFGFHLMASDALSLSIFLRDLDRTYQMLPLPAIPSSYLDFTRQQRDALDAGYLEEGVSFWKRQLDPCPGVLPLLPVASVQCRRPRRRYGHHIIQKELAGDLVHGVRRATQTCGATLMQFYLAVMQVLLARLADVDDVCVGVTDSGRGSGGDFSKTIGHFANILPMRFAIKTDRSFAELVRTTSHIVLGAMDHANVPFDVLLERLGIERSTVHTPLFQVAFNYRLGDILKRPLGDLTMEMERYLDVKTGYDLTINVTQTAERGHVIECATSDSLYSESATHFILDTYVGLIESLSGDPSVVVKDCKLFTGVQIERALALGRGPTVRHQWPETLPERFDRVCAAYPDAIAIKDADGAMTYKELARRIDAHAACLSAEAPRGTQIAVLCEPGIELYAVMLAVLYIDAVYIPLDTSLPTARHAAMMDACEADVLVFDAATAESAAQLASGRGLGLINLSDSILGPSLPLPQPQTSTRDSFLLFTSGSTGVPKGIRLGQAGIMNYAASKSAVLGLEGAVVLQQTSTGFDMAIAQAFNAFANGGTLVVAPARARGDPCMIAKIMLDEGVTFTLATPTEYLMLATYAGDVLRRCTAWRHACSGGETVTDGLIGAMKRLEMPIMLTDCYGPTEVSCATTFRSIPMSFSKETDCGDQDVPGSVGRAIPNTSVYILGGDDSVMPVGMPGEICVGGCGVARGYLDDGMDIGAFVRNEFASPEEVARGWTRMYKTGDRGVLDSDGSLRFLGRIGGDSFIKLRGLRIDLNEVADAILKAAPDELVDAIVTVRGEPQFLVAHVVFAQGRRVEVPQLKCLLDVALPRYMVPSTIVPLERLPMTTNGKVDRRAVQALNLPEHRGNVDETCSLTVPEGELRGVWLGVLGEAASGSSLNADSGFFTVGGSSLLLVRLQNALRERFGVFLPLHRLYQATTLRGMAAAMHEERGRPAEDAIDWEAETAIPPSLLMRTASEARPPRKRDRHVLLTGSTSFLGREVLRELICNDDVAKVHCVAVPEGEEDQVPDDGKVVKYPGSLLSSTLGLSSTQTAYLRETVDQIIHAAVQGHCMNNYTSVRQALYVSTRTLVSLGSPRRAPFHLISAPRVVLLSGQHGAKPESMAAHPPPTDGSQGVTAAKWASEVFLERASRELGLPVTIHRHCALVGDGAPGDDVMNAVVRFSRTMRKVPALQGGYLDFTDVRGVAGDVARHEGGMGVEYRHHSSGVKVPVGEFAKRMGEIYGGQYETVSPGEWLRGCKEEGMDEVLALHLGGNMERPMVFPYLGPV